MVRNPLSAGPTGRAKASSKQGQAGYDNPRENIDPHIKTQVIETQEIVGQTIIISGANFVVTKEGKVGIGTASPSRKVHIYSAHNSPSASTESLYMQTSSNYIGPYIIVGGMGHLQYQGTGSDTNAIGIGLRGRATHYNSGTVGLLRGLHGTVDTSGTNNGTINSGSGVYSEIVTSAGSLIVNAYGVNVGSISNSGTLTNTYGVYVGDITTGTQTNTPFSFYASDANAYNYLAGKVGIGTSSPGNTLDVLDPTVGNTIVAKFKNAWSATPQYAGIQIGDATIKSQLHNAERDLYFDPGTSGGATIFTQGNVGIGTSSPATSAKLDISSTTGALLVPRMTTAQMNALTAVNGMIIYDSTLNKFMFYENGSWVSGSGLT